MTKLKCSMHKTCEHDVSYIDEKGFVYCETHGLRRKTYYRCRKLKPKEKKQLESGEPLKKY